MNEREFLKEIKQKGNEGGDFTPSIVDDLIQQGKALQIARKENLFARLLRRARKTKSTSQIVGDNLETILERTVDNQLGVLLEILIGNEETLGVVENRFDVIFARLQEPQNVEEDKEMQVMKSARNKFLEQFRKTKNAEAVLIEHMDSILQGTVTMEDIRTLQGLSAQTDEKLNAKLEREKEIVARELLGNIEFSRKTAKQREQLIDDYIPTVARILQELLKDQNEKKIDIGQIGRGTYSRVYQVKDKVLKIGKPRKTHKIPNHPRLLQPLTRTSLIDEQDGNEIFACVEIYDRADKLCKEDLQVEKLYQVYKELRDDGIIWTDARFANVGKLRSRNVPKLNGEEMNVDPVAVGMDRKVDGKVLEVGEWVIIDLDYIYRQEDNSIDWDIKDSYAKAFEKRWQLERQGKIVARYQKKEKENCQGDYTKSYESRDWEKHNVGEER